MTKYFKDRFAVYGDLVAIPDNTQKNGSVSYQQGFGVDYQRKLGTDPLAKPFPRQGFNGLMSDITGAIQQYQQNGFFDFITPELNGGVPFEYAMGAVVRYDLSDDGTNIRNFISLINKNDTNPKDSPDNWQDISEVDIEFATPEETIEGIVSDKVISPLSLSALTANTSRKGLVQIATETETKAGTNNTKATTPAGVLSMFSSKKMAESGYQVLPGGLIIQWARIYISSAGTSYTFPIAFPNQCFALTIGTGEDETSAAEVMNMKPNTLTKTGFVGNATATSHYTYIAIGN